MNPVNDNRVTHPLETGFSPRPNAENVPLGKRTMVQLSLQNPSVDKLASTVRDTGIRFIHVFDSKRQFEQVDLTLQANQNKDNLHRRVGIFLNRLASSEFREEHWGKLWEASRKVAGFPGGALTAAQKQQCYEQILEAFAYQWPVPGENQSAALARASVRLGLLASEGASSLSAGRFRNYATGDLAARKVMGGLHDTAAAQFQDWFSSARNSLTLQHAPQLADTLFLLEKLQYPDAAGAVRDHLLKLIDRPFLQLREAIRETDPDLRRAHIAVALRSLSAHLDRCDAGLTRRLISIWLGNRLLPHPAHVAGMVAALGEIGDGEMRKMLAGQDRTLSGTQLKTTELMILVFHSLVRHERDLVHMDVSAPHWRGDHNNAFGLTAEIEYLLHGMAIPLGQTKAQGTHGLQSDASVLDNPSVPDPAETADLTETAVAGTALPPLGSGNEVRISTHLAEKPESLASGWHMLEEDADSEEPSVELEVSTPTVRFLVEGDNSRQVQMETFLQEDYKSVSRLMESMNAMAQNLLGDAQADVARERAVAADQTVRFMSDRPLDRLIIDHYADASDLEFDSRTLQTVAALFDHFLSAVSSQPQRHLVAFNALAAIATTINGQTSSGFTADEILLRASQPVFANARFAEIEPVFASLQAIRGKPLGEMLAYSAIETAPPGGTQMNANSAMSVFKSLLNIVKGQHDRMKPVALTASSLFDARRDI
ncbi:MAG: hypothetical protein ACRYGK_16950 [Janthinobacterium lividum]